MRTDGVEITGIGKVSDEFRVELDSKWGSPYPRYSNKKGGYSVSFSVHKGEGYLSVSSHTKGMPRKLKKRAAYVIREWIENTPKDDHPHKIREYFNGEIWLETKEDNNKLELLYECSSYS